MRARSRSRRAAHRTVFSLIAVQGDTQVCGDTLEVMPCGNAYNLQL